MYSKLTDIVVSVLDSVFNNLNNWRQDSVIINYFTTILFQNFRLHINLLFDTESSDNSYVIIIFDEPIS